MWRWPQGVRVQPTRRQARKRVALRLRPCLRTSCLHCLLCPQDPSSMTAREPTLLPTTPTTPLAALQNTRKSLLSLTLTVSNPHPSLASSSFSLILWWMARCAYSLWCPLHPSTRISQKFRHFVWRPSPRGGELRRGIRAGLRPPLSLAFAPRAAVRPPPPGGGPRQRQRSEPTGSCPNRRGARRRSFARRARKSRWPTCLSRSSRRSSVAPPTESIGKRRRTTRRTHSGKAAEDEQEEANAREFRFWREGTIRTGCRTIRSTWSC